MLPVCESTESSSVSNSLEGLDWPVDWLLSLAASRTVEGLDLAVCDELLSLAASGNDRVEGSASANGCFSSRKLTAEGVIACEVVV